MQEIKDKVMPTKTIVVRAEIYQALDALKMIPQEPFNSVIKRLLEQSRDLIRTMPNEKMPAANQERPMPTTIVPLNQPCLTPSIEKPI